jgi:AcrR family transcriptional regulator
MHTFIVDSVQFPNSLSRRPPGCTLSSMPYPSKTDRQTILTTAMQQTAREGIENLAMRSVAAALHLAPNALYRYFANLSALKAALAEESRALLLKVLKSAAGAKAPEKAIRSIALAYMKFAQEKPHVFALTLMPLTTEAEENGVHRESWRFFRGQVAKIYGETRASEAAVALWAFLHGMTVLRAAEVFGETKPASSFEFGLQMWIGAASAER